MTVKLPPIDTAAFIELFHIPLSVRSLTVKDAGAVVILTLPPVYTVTAPIVLVPVALLKASVPLTFVVVTVRPVVNEFKVSIPEVTVSVPTVVVAAVFAKVAPFASFNSSVP